ncbi:MAG: hypothetical protein CVV44_13935 [Spirochaetae bacterium HGW-Spirochaetae-1]|jgi:hypothetical protein|nr:MAG: hypothetical protein CVV44_13935 [Spirochaetae bacterium HGW-Spirochaetae-1]
MPFILPNFTMFICIPYFSSKINFFSRQDRLFTAPMSSTWLQAFLKITAVAQGHGESTEEEGRGYLSAHAINCLCYLQTNIGTHFKRLKRHLSWLHFLPFLDQRVVNIIHMFWKKIKSLKL